MQAHGRPLEGMRAIALEHAVAAPLCSRHLADMGCDVIKIERPGTGDFARDYDSFVHGQSSHFVWLNRGKRSLCLDVKQPAAKDALMRLIGTSDILLQNLAPGAAARLGLSYEALKPANSKLIVADISGYGESGPFVQKKAYDLLIQAESGLIAVTGSPDEPSRVGISAADICTGMYALTGILGALVRGRISKSLCSTLWPSGRRNRCCERSTPAPWCRALPPTTRPSPPTARTRPRTDRSSSASRTNENGRCFATR